jgi:ribosomal protein L18E
MRRISLLGKVLGNGKCCNRVKVVAIANLGGAFQPKIYKSDQLLSKEIER